MDGGFEVENKQLLDYLVDYIKGNYSPSEPIYTRRIFDCLKSSNLLFQFTIDDLLDSLDFIVDSDGELIEGFCRYEEEDDIWLDSEGDLVYDDDDSEGWIYYISETEENGRLKPIDELSIFEDRFVKGGKGFPSGAYLLKKEGFYEGDYDGKMEYRSNVSESDRIRIPKSLKDIIVLSKPICEATEENVEYLKMIDMVFNFVKGKHKINVYNPIKRFQNLIEERGLEYKILKKYAELYPFIGDVDKKGNKVTTFLGSNLNVMLNNIRHYY